MYTFKVLYTVWVGAPCSYARAVMASIQEIKEINRRY
jgi:hypothetical protein